MKTTIRLIGIAIIIFSAYSIYNDYKPSKAVKELSYELKEVGKKMDGGWN